MASRSNTQDVSERTAILVVATGGSSGLGLEALASYVKQSEKDIILVLGCRNPSDPLITTRLGEAPNVRKLDAFELELTNSDSIRRFATHVLETYSQKISVLLLCAGAMYAKRVVDSSGIEQTLKVNALSQGFLLEYLWSRLFEPADGMVRSRVVFVASSLHKKAAQQYEVSPSSIGSLLNGNSWKSMSAYSISKLVQMHLFKIVDDAFAKVEDTESRPTAVAVSPGFVPQTGLARDTSWLTRQFMTYIMPMFPFTTSMEEGGDTIARAMIAQDIQPGTYLSPRGEETLAADCLDPVLRSKWRDWLISNGVQID
ncbi:hypothetical protein RSOLAG1IB_03416 [Rhizoctonia solani AG-1 IB]|uniref:Uncharacterized protein n=1 Tax=Thanatephorus cucumeris (strain AG1-IB / isolate 7/3/14) TaxID=1108050 RepID=A0A0B7FTC7_THACB|nr:hypothetical protein RSOLAG1IB_03416 [Rhizoctonia solani AG-1 IB]